MASKKVWTEEMEENLIEMWQEHECLFDISNEMYHNRAEKEKRWTEIANALQQPGELTLNTVFKLGRGCPEVKI